MILILLGRATKPAPLVTESFTETLEDCIARRIQEGRFDDVTPRDPPTAAELHNDGTIL